MASFFQSCIVGVWLFCTLVSTVSAGMPTFSLEVSAVNSVQLHAPVSRLTVIPNDRITAEVYLRDWSPKGEKLYAYQAQINPGGFTSGPSGYIEPVDFAQTQKEESDNRSNCFVNRNHSRYAHAKFLSMALSDSRSEGYRWMSAMMQEDGPVSRQDGTKFYCGTIHLQVSENATGTFTLGLVENDDYTGLRQPPGASIFPVAFESLTVDVRGSSKPGYVALLIERINQRGREATPEATGVEAAMANVQRAVRAIQMLNVSGSGTQSLARSPS